MTEIICDERASTAGFESRLKRVADQVDAVLADILPEANGPEANLMRAMRHGVLSGGKRLRPYLVVETGQILGADPAACLRAGAALECIHAYSLIHDDLPALDADMERRGMPSVHARYGEASAILAGDALLTLAFEILVDDAMLASASVRCALALASARAAGVRGMVGGQMIDILGSSVQGAYDHGGSSQDGGREVGPPTNTILIRMARMKTGALFCLACELAVILAGADGIERQALAGFSRDLGLAYQMLDDIDDSSGAQEAGFVAALGLHEASGRAQMLADQAREHLAVFGVRAAPLCALIDHMARNRARTAS